jgi:hypothetical protein
MNHKKTYSMVQTTISHCLGLQGDDGESVIVDVGIGWWCCRTSWECRAVGNIIIKRLDSKTENRLVSTDKEINNTTNIPLGPNNASCHLGHVSFQLQCITFEVGGVGGVGRWIEEWGKQCCGSLVVVGSIAQSGATCYLGSTHDQGLCTATELYKPSLNEHFLPGHVPLHYIMVEMVKINSIYSSLLSVTLKYFIYCEKTGCN